MNDQNKELCQRVNAILKEWNQLEEAEANKEPEQESEDDFIGDLSDSKQFRKLNIKKKQN